MGSDAGRISGDVYDAEVNEQNGLLQSLVSGSWRKNQSEEKRKETKAKKTQV